MPIQTCTHISLEKTEKGGTRFGDCKVIAIKLYDKAFVKTLNTAGLIVDIDESRNDLLPVYTIELKHEVNGLRIYQCDWNEIKETGEMSPEEKRDTFT